MSNYVLDKDFLYRKVNWIRDGLAYTWKRKTSLEAAEAESGS